MKHLAGHYYHVYNRGCNRESIFTYDGNYHYLLRQAKKILPGANVTVIAYCLMPNHYHFLLRSEIDRAVGHFIQVLFNGYTQAYNRQQRRSGSLFEIRAKSIQVDEEGYLIHLCRYIHLNPVTAGLVQKPEDWLYSNYLEWIARRDGTLIDRDFMQTYFVNPDEYATFIRDSMDEVIAVKLARYCLD